MPRGGLVIMVDGDDSYDWSDMGRLIGKICQVFDLVAGNRFKCGITRRAMITGRIPASFLVGIIDLQRESRRSGYAAGRHLTRPAIRAAI